MQYRRQDIGFIHLPVIHCFVFILNRIQNSRYKFQYSIIKDDYHLYNHFVSKSYQNIFLVKSDFFLVSFLYKYSNQTIIRPCFMHFLSNFALIDQTLPKLGHSVRNCLQIKSNMPIFSTISAGNATLLHLVSIFGKTFHSNFPQCLNYSTLYRIL